MTITEFLLARLAEDEANPRAVSTVDEYRAHGDAEWTRSADGHVPVGDWEIRYSEKPDPRWMAECEAKRRIVEMITVAEVRTTADDLMPEGAEWRLGQRNALWRTCALLAAVYADHPDYDPAWRP